MAALRTGAAAHCSARSDGNFRDEYSNWSLGTGWMRLARFEQWVGCGTAVLPVQMVKSGRQPRPSA
jgi:hypothetical protein